MAGSCYATRCERVQKRHLARSRVIRIPSRQAPFLIRHILLLLFDDSVLRLIPFPFLAEKITRLVESKDERILRLRAENRWKQKVTVPSYPPAYKMERVSSVVRRVFDRERLEFSTRSI